MVLASVDGSDGGGGDIGGQAPGNQVPCIYTRSLKKKKKTLRTRERSSDRICRSGGTRRGYILSAGGGLGARRFYIKCRARVHIDRSAAVSSIRNSGCVLLLWSRGTYHVGGRPNGQSAICAGHRENLCTPHDSTTGDVKAAAG